MSAHDERDGIALWAALEGAADYFFGRPLEENPYSHDDPYIWESWRHGWKNSSHLKYIRGDVERRLWYLP